MTISGRTTRLEREVRHRELHRQRLERRRVERQAWWDYAMDRLYAKKLNWVAVSCLLTCLFVAVVYYIGAEAREKRRPTTTQKIVVVVTNATAPKYHFVRVN